jgi:hypothetical protein
MMKSQRHREDMTAAELAQFTGEFDAPFAFEKGRPMTPAERADERKLRRGRGRPKRGIGARKISISLEGELLE